MLWKFSGYRFELPSCQLGNWEELPLQASCSQPQITFRETWLPGRAQVCTPHARPCRSLDTHTPSQELCALLAWTAMMLRSLSSKTSTSSLPSFLPAFPSLPPTLSTFLPLSCCPFSLPPLPPSCFHLYLFYTERDAIHVLGHFLLYFYIILMKSFYKVLTV